MALMARLAHLDLLEQGDISFHGTHSDCDMEIRDPQSSLSTAERLLIDRNLNTNMSLPRILDQSEVGGNFSAHFGIEEYKLWQRSLSKRIETKKLTLY